MKKYFRNLHDEVHATWSEAAQVQLYDSVMLLVHSCQEIKEALYVLLGLILALAYILTLPVSFPVCLCIRRYNSKRKYKQRLGVNTL